ncbi:hypothetical protein D3C72_2226020 [compost metagenome]
MDPDVVNCKTVLPCCGLQTRSCGFNFASANEGTRLIVQTTQPRFQVSLYIGVSARRRDGDVLDRQGSDFSGHRMIGLLVRH